MRNGESWMAVLVPPVLRKPCRFCETCAVAKRRGERTPFQLATNSVFGSERVTSVRGSIEPVKPGRFFCTVRLSVKPTWTVWLARGVAVPFSS